MSLREQWTPGTKLICVDASKSVGGVRESHTITFEYTVSHWGTEDYLWVVGVNAPYEPRRFKASCRLFDHHWEETGRSHGTDFTRVIRKCTVCGSVMGSTELNQKEITT